MLNADGTPLDVDVVINEVLESGGEVFVEYGPGPTQFATRWEGRPQTPPFEWQNGGLKLPPHDLWLQDLHFPSEWYKTALPQYNHHARHEYLDREVKENVILNYTGVLQSIFSYYANWESDFSPGHHLNVLTSHAWKQLVVDAGIVAQARGSNQLTAQQCDDLLLTFTNMAARDEEAQAKAGTRIKTGTSDLDLKLFLIFLPWLASAKFAQEEPESELTLAEKTESLILNHLIQKAGTKINTKLAEQFQGAWNEKSQRWLGAASELCAQLLHLCQLKRSRQVQEGGVRLDMQHFLLHLNKWGFIPTRLEPAEMALCYVCVMQPRPDECTLEHAEVVPTPMSMNQDQFGKVLVMMAKVVFEREKGEGEEFETFIPTFLNEVFLAAGVLGEELEPQGV